MNLSGGYSELLLLRAVRPDTISTTRVASARLAQLGALQHDSLSATSHASTLKKTNDYHDERDDQKNVNDSAKCVRGDQPK